MRLSTVAHFSTSKVTPSVPLSLVDIIPIRIVMVFLDDSTSPDLVPEAIHLHAFRGNPPSYLLCLKLFYLNLSGVMR